jgi:hypothetical protein
MMTQEEAQEWDYRVQERLGILVGDQKATPRQTMLAMDEADAAIAAIRREAQARVEREMPL